MGAATGAMRCRPNDGETRCVTGNLELERYLRDETGTVGPNTGASTPHMPRDKSFILKAVLDLWTLISALFIIGFVLSRARLRNNRANWLILNAVFVCLLNAAFVDPILLDVRASPATSWRFGALYCYMLFGGPADILGAMVPLTLIMVVIERLLYIRNPGRKEERHLSVGGCVAMIVAPWTVMSLVTVFVVYVFKTPRYGTSGGEDDNREQCTLETETNVWAKVTFASWFSLSLAIPVGLMNLAAMVAIGSVCCAKIPTNETDALSEKKERREVRHAGLLITVLTVLFTLAAVPSAVAYITTHTNPESTPVSFEIVVTLQMAFRAVQPVIWLLLAPDIRSAAYDLFCGWREGNRKRDEQTRLIKVTGSPTKTPE